MSFIRFTFADKQFEGRVIDDYGRVVYNLSTENGWHTYPTYVYRPNGEPIGDLAWGGLTHGQRITIYGRTSKSLIERKKEKWYKTSQWIFQDGSGNEFIWKELECRNAAGQPIAFYTRIKEHLTKDDEKAVLTVDHRYLPILDLLLFTALELETRRRADEASRRAAIAGGAAAAAS